MAKPELGTKRTCPSCGARFYDLHKRPIVCPKCSNSFEPEALFKPKRQRTAKAAAEVVAEEDPKAKELEKEEPAEEETVEDEEVEDEEVEDIKELGTDSDAVEVEVDEETLDEDEDDDTPRNKRKTPSVDAIDEEDLAELSDATEEDETESDDMDNLIEDVDDLGGDDDVVGLVDKEDNDETDR